MSIHKKRFLVLLFISLILSGVAPVSTSAQESLNVQVTSIRTASFPDIWMYVSVTRPDGERVTDLTAADFNVLEGENEISPSSVREERLGTRQVYLINTSLASGLRDASGKTRLDYAVDALQEWWQLPDAARLGLDDLSLYTAESALAIHETSAAVLASRLDAYTPQFQLETAPYQRIQQVLRAARDPLPREGMTTSLIFVTPFVRGPELEDLEAAITEARELNVTVYTLLLADPDELENPLTVEMSRLSEETGGELFLFDPDEGLGNLARRIISEQSQYVVRYTSKANTSGEHSLTLLAQSSGSAGNSSPLSFSVDLQPPAITFERVPEDIVRQTEDQTQPLEEVPPTSSSIRISVSFPDNLPRELESTSLWVDGEQVEINTSPPFVNFEWDISSYTTDGIWTLTARVEDNLGLTAETEEVPVSITFDLPPSGLAALQPVLSRIFLTAASIFLVVAALAVVVIMIRKSVIRPDRPDQGTRISRQPAAAGLRTTNQSEDEVPEASLISLDSDILTVNLTGIDHVIGKDPSLATILLPDPSVEALHARLIRHADGRYLIKDTGSVAGTWVNYHEIPESGMILHHGDLIHFGRNAFRFDKPAPTDRTPQLTVMQPDTPNGEQQRLENAHDPDK
jgi:pSer/pThr/pTyr-binding forkhead associated (FHA) protein